MGYSRVSTGRRHMEGAPTRPTLGCNTHRCWQSRPRMLAWEQLTTSHHKPRTGTVHVAASGHTTGLAWATTIHIQLKMRPSVFLESGPPRQHTPTSQSIRTSCQQRSVATSGVRVDVLCHWSTQGWRSCTRLPMRAQQRSAWNRAHTARPP